MSAKGGITEGKSHAEGGIPMEVKSTGQQVELEGGEGVINKRNMASTKTFDFEGKKMTICEIASKINSTDGNGVQINCDNVTGTKYKYAKGGKILNEDEEESFKEWMDDGNVISFEKDVYSTQDAQYRNRLKGMDELRKYFRKEFLSDSYSEGGNVNQELKMDYDFRSLLLPNEKQFFLQSETKGIEHKGLIIFTDGKREIVFSRYKTKLKKLGNASNSTKALYDKYFADGGYVDLETYNFNELRGKYINLYSMGVELPTENQIVDVTLSSPQFRYRYLTLKFDLGNAQIKFNDIEDFLNEEIVYVKTDKEEFGVQLIPNQFAKGGRTKNAMKLDDYENASISMDNYEDGAISSNPTEFAKGGEVDLPKANKMFHLPLELSVYVPSTQDVDKVISERELKERVNEVSEYLARLFGGFTKSDKIGGFMSSKSELVTEDVVPVVSFATESDFNANKNKLVNKLSEWAKRWGQEAIGFEFEGDLYYVPESFANGGGIKKIKYEDMTKQKHADGGEIDNEKVFEAQEDGIVGISSGSDAYTIEISKGDKFVTHGNQDNKYWWFVKMLDKKPRVMQQVNSFDYYENKPRVNVNTSNLILTFPRGDKGIYAEMKELYAKGGKAKGVEWMKSDGQYEAELGDLYLIIEPATERGLYQVRVKKGYRGETIGVSLNEISGLDKAKDLAYDIAGDYYKQFEDGGGIEGFTNDTIYTEGNISIQRVGGSAMWNVAINNKSVGRITNAYTKEQAFKKVKKEKFADGGGVHTPDYIDEKYMQFVKEFRNLRLQYGSDYKGIEILGFLAIDESDERLSDYEFEGQDFSPTKLMEVAKEYPQAKEIVFVIRLMGDNQYGLYDEGYTEIDDLAMTFDMARLNQYGKGGDVRDFEWYQMWKKDQVKKGTAHEMEHIDTIREFKKRGVSDKEVAQAIAKDHLEEDENYYIELEKMQESSEKVSNALQDFEHQKSKRKSSRKYKLGGLLGDNKSVNVHIILVEDYEAVVRSKDGTYLNDVNLKKDKVYKFGFLFDEGKDVAFDLGDGSDSFMLVPSNLVVVVGYDDEKMELGGEVKSYADYKLDKNDKSILKLLLNINPRNATAEQRDKVSTFKGNNIVNDLSPKLIQKIYGILFQNHNVDNKILNLYITNIGVGNILMYAPSYLHKTMVGFDEKNEFVQVEKEIANIVTEGVRAFVFNEFELTDMDGFIHVYPQVNPKIDDLCSIFYKSKKKAVAVGVCEFTSKQKLDEFQRSIVVNQGSLSLSQMISFAKSNDYLIVNEGITSEGDYTLIYTMTKY
jgi:hypothetical protein